MKFLKIIFAFLVLTGIFFLGYTLLNSTQAPIQQGDFDNTICWNFASEKEDGVYWRNGCGGRKSSAEVMCTQVETKMSESQLEGWRKWEAAGKPEIPGCN